MSRGLGKLQRFIKEQIYRAEREYDRERVALEGRRRVILQRLGRDHFNRGERDPFDDGVKRWVVYWWDVRRWVDQNPAFNPDPEQYRLSEALERSAKRALHGLVQRGEIVQDREGKYATYYTIEMQKRLEDIGKGFAEDLSEPQQSSARCNLKAKKIPPTSAGDSLKNSAIRAPQIRPVAHLFIPPRSAAERGVRL